MVNEQREQKELGELINAWERRLHKLKVRVALEGRSARPEDAIEIEDIETKVENLKLRRIELREGKEAAPEELSTFRQEKEELEKREEEPLELRAGFVNREDELRNLLSPHSKNFIIVSAPPGYGKTHMLDEVNRRLQDEETEWLVIRHDCDPRDSEMSILVSLAQQLRHSSNREPIRDLDEFLIYLSQALGYAMVDGLFLQFDSVERWKKDDAWAANARWVQAVFAPALQGASQDSDWRLRVILAGRYIGNWTDDFELPYQEMNLSLFDLEVIRIFVRETLQRLKETPRGKWSLTPEEVAAEIFDITGGHPGAVVRLTEDMAITGFQLSLDRYFRSEKKVMLFNKFVKAEIGNLFRGIPGAIQTVFNVLSVFRGFNGDTLDALFATGHINGADRDGWDLYSDILHTHLVEQHVQHGPLARDRILQRVLDTKMRFTEPDRYRILNEFAVGVYDHWLRGENHQGEELPSGEPTGTDQIQFMVESLYHTCRACEDKVACKKDLEAKLQAFLTQLRYPGRPVEGRRALRKAIRSDEQLPILLKESLGEGSYNSLLDTFEQA